MDEALAHPPDSVTARDANTAHTPPVTAARAHVHLSRRLTVASLIALIALGLAWELWLAPIGRGTLAVKVLPLCLPLAGLLKNRMYTYRWLSLLVWLYVLEGLIRATSGEPVRVVALAVAEILLGLALFTGCVLHIRLRLRDARQPRTSETASATP
ncbi:DUF2069 domain-containing protein [Hylemonella gracilis]|uniref:DUF2069 domain-containing protein n=1 Tax=Hylemonella gracilis TaxID=80880 RepID=A0A4P6UQS7_9BURK|nr:DUF2069 domain-containing protein [Hylemonella gracilis]QBK06517.1 DUF2069 domain-containing protein [Hylemonella gracilis]